MSAGLLKPGPTGEPGLPKDKIQVKRWVGGLTAWHAWVCLPAFLAAVVSLWGPAPKAQSLRIPKLRHPLPNLQLPEPHAGHAPG